MAHNFQEAPHGAIQSLYSYLESCEDWYPNRFIIPILRGSDLSGPVPEFLDPVREAFVDGIEFEAPFPASLHSYLKERPFPAGPKNKASAAFLFPLCQFNDWPVWLPDEREGIGADAPVKVDCYGLSHHAPSISEGAS
ncbi:hypothetical protein [Anaerotruncus sp. G3(2012)]|uniref:hypothetical protein n=1 Tax=Anaerotruncus sp. G3(2012) TaxID=1235835 RepID=UPI0012DFE658|nr:hypothetical protein [Anaerotruncus sp. G3(2012)]